jgi:hypothetical protein
MILELLHILDTPVFFTTNTISTTMSSNNSLSANYTAPFSEPKTFSRPLPPSSKGPSTSERTTYLVELQTSVTAIQDQINVFLTQKMEEDNKKAGVIFTVDDTNAEENFGEEVVDGND